MKARSGFRPLPLLAAFAIAGAVLLPAEPGQATTLVRAGLPELFERADLVIEAKVTKSAVVEIAARPGVFTDYTLSPTHTYKGESADALVVRHPGGKIARGELLIEGMPKLEVGSTVIVFLEALPKGAFEDDETRYLTLGMWQGHFVLSGDGSRFARNADSNLALISPMPWCTGGEDRVDFDAKGLRAWLAEVGR